MKKNLKLLSQLIVISSFSLPTIACGRVIDGSEMNPGKPEEPSIKDISYYQALIDDQEQYLIDLDQTLEEIKANKDGYEDKIDYQSALDEVIAEQYFCQALINEYQYQILLLEKQDDKFTLEQILRGIIIFKQKINNLEQELKIKEKYSYYTEEEKQVIKDAIIESKTILKMFEDLREED